MKLQGDYCFFALFQTPQTSVFISWHQIRIDIKPATSTIRNARTAIDLGRSPLRRLKRSFSKSRLFWAYFESGWGGKVAGEGLLNGILCWTPSFFFASNQYHLQTIYQG